MAVIWQLVMGLVLILTSVRRDFPRIFTFIQRTDENGRVEHW